MSNAPGNRPSGKSYSRVVALTSAIDRSLHAVQPPLTAPETLSIELSLIVTTLVRYAERGWATEARVAAREIADVLVELANAADGEAFAAAARTREVRDAFWATPAPEVG